MPTIRVCDIYDKTLGNDADKIAKYVGIELLEWQIGVANDFLSLDDSGKWKHGRNGLSVPRQNGKSYLVIAICLYLVLVKNCRVAYTAQNYSTVLDIFDRFKRIFGSKANDQYAPFGELNDMVLRVRGTASREGIELKRVVDDEGNSYDPCISFSTRTESSLRGQTYDVLVIDEAQFCTSGQFSSIGPVTKSGPIGNSMQIFIGTPETPTKHGEIFGNVRKDALGDSPERTCWIEWSVDEVGDVLDRSRWYETNPSLGILGDESEMRSAAGTMAPFDFAQEYLGYWVASNGFESVIKEDEWSACKLGAPPDDGVQSYGVKFSADGAVVSVSVCSKSEETHFVELLFNEPTARGTQWLVDFIVERKSKLACVCIDGQSGAQSLIDRLDGNVPRRMLMRPKIQDVISAHKTFKDYVCERKVSHAGIECLTNSVVNSSKRNIGHDGGFGWQSNEIADASIVESAALAVMASDKAKRNPNRETGVAF